MPEFQRPETDLGDIREAPSDVATRLGRIARRGRNPEHEPTPEPAERAPVQEPFVIFARYTFSSSELEDFVTWMQCIHLYLVAKMVKITKADSKCDRDGWLLVRMEWPSKDAFKADRGTPAQLTAHEDAEKHGVEYLTVEVGEAIWSGEVLYPAGPSWSRKDGHRPIFEITI